MVAPRAFNLDAENQVVLRGMMHFLATGGGAEGRSVEGDSLSPATRLGLVRMGGDKPGPLMDHVGEWGKNLDGIKTLLPMLHGDAPGTTTSPDHPEQPASARRETPIGTPAFVERFRSRSKASWL